MIKLAFRVNEINSNYYFTQNLGAEIYKNSNVLAIVDRI